MIVNGVAVVADERLNNEEISELVLAEIDAWRRRQREIGFIELSLDGEEIIVKTVEKSPIRRVRRITGYLSNLENFNEAKRAECNGRVEHR